MLSNQVLRLAIFATLGALSAFAQTAISVVSSSYPIGNTTVNGTQYSLSVGVTYPTNLSPSSYISGTQLATDVKGFLSAYPNPTDPPEAQLSSALSSLLAKYSQMAGGDLIASVTPSVSPTGQVTLGATVDVIIGNFTTSPITFASRNPAAQVARIAQPQAIPAPKTGN